MRRESISSELLMCGGGVAVFFVASCGYIYICMYMAHVVFYVCCRECVEICGNICYVTGSLLNIVVLALDC